MSAQQHTSKYRLGSPPPIVTAITHSSATSEDDWEDFSDGSNRESKRFNRSASFTNRINQSPRKRKTLPKPASATRRSATPVVKTTETTDKSENTMSLDFEEIRHRVNFAASSAAVYIYDILTTAIRLLRHPLYFITLLYLLSVIVSYVSPTIRSAFAPLCYLPGLHSMRICQFDKRTSAPRWADYPKLVDVQSATFEHLLDQSISGAGLSLEIKKAEMATTDLATLVRISNLKSRQTLADSLGEFVLNAKKTGRGLSRLSSKIGGAVDTIMAVNDYALNEIAAAHAKHAPSITNMYGVAPWHPKDQTNEIVTRTFGDAMFVLSSHMQRLILEAEVNLADLEKLEEHLGTLHELVSREDNSISSEKAEVLSELWTKLGGNKKQLRSFEDHLLMLQNLGGYRKQALAHVVSALQSLQAMSSDMEDIRERVAAPELTGSRIPVEVHMKSIREGLERLKEGRLRAKKLEDESIHRVFRIDSDSELDDV